MDLSANNPISPTDDAGLVVRLVRCALVLYLSPAILVVLAIGLVAILAAKLGKPTTRVAIKGVGSTIEGFHPGHEPNHPMGLAKSPVQVREVV
jgi:hypothetical protein